MIVVPGSIPKMIRSFANFNLLFCAMVAIPDKAKQFLVFIVKLLIVTAAFYFIWKQLTENEKLDWQNFLVLFEQNKSVGGILFLLSFSFLNRFLEILKWKNLVSFIRPITTGEASKQVLGALTAGIFTPNGIGEYAGKALFFEAPLRKKVIFLNLICNGIQMILSVLFGLLGLLFLGFGSWVLIVLGIALFFVLGSLLLKNITIKGYSIRKLIEKINKIPKQLHRKNILLATFRYLTFSHQYYFLFLAFNVDLPYLTLIAAIAATYFLASSLPSFQFLDFAVKGSVAVYFFGILGVNEWIVVFISFVMWLLNVAIPVAIGSYFVLNFKPAAK